MAAAEKDGSEIQMLAKQSLKYPQAICYNNLHISVYERFGLDMLSLLPKMMFDRLDLISVEQLKESGIQLLLLDFDNTIVPYTTSKPIPAVAGWLQEASKQIPICVVSNSHRPRVKQFCAAYGLACITHSRKPTGKGIRQALAAFSCEPEHAALVGDQIYTDILGANCAGLTSILVRPILLHNMPLRLRHLLEKPFIKMGKRRCFLEKH